MSTISVRPLKCLLERGAGLPALQVAVEFYKHADGVCLLLNAAALASWPVPVVRGLARLPVGEVIGPDGAAVCVAALGAGGLVSVLMGGRFLFSLELGLDGGLLAACVGRPDAVLRPAIA